MAQMQQMLQGMGGGGGAGPGAGMPDLGALMECAYRMSTRLFTWLHPHSLLARGPGTAHRPSRHGPTPRPSPLRAPLKLACA